MPTIERHAFPDESPTKPVENIPTRTLALAARTKRLAELALERLRDHGDVSGACSAIEQLHALASAVAA